MLLSTHHEATTEQLHQLGTCRRSGAARGRGALGNDDTVSKEFASLKGCRRVPGPTISTISARRDFSGRRHWMLRGPLTQGFNVRLLQG
jgi:hypothetical protein